MGKVQRKVKKYRRKSSTGPFSHMPAWARFLIVFAGPAFNFLFALMVFWIMFAVDGVPHLAPDVGKVRPDMPAAAAGILPGDKIVSINGRAVTYWDDVLLLVRGLPGPPCGTDRGPRRFSQNFQPDAQHGGNAQYFRGRGNRFP